MSTWVERTREGQNFASCKRTWPVTVGSAIDACRAVLMALEDAMCEFPAATSSDTDEEEFHHNIFNVDVVTSYRPSERLEEYLAGEEIGRVGRSCHFATDCLCENLSELVWPSPFTRLVNMRFPARMTLCAQGSLAQLTWPFSGDPAGLEAGPMPFTRIGPARAGDYNSQNTCGLTFSEGVIFIMSFPSRALSTVHGDSKYTRLNQRFSFLAPISQFEFKVLHVCITSNYPVTLRVCHSLQDSLHQIFASEPSDCQKYTASTRMAS